MTNSQIASETSQHSLRDRWRISVYLAQVEWYLEGILTYKERKSALQAVRKELLTDPRGVVESVATLGPPAVLAARFTKRGIRRPLWSVGIIAAGLALFVYWGLLLSFAAGMLAAVEASAVAEAHATYLFFDVMASSTADGIGIGWTGYAAGLIVMAAVVAVAFIIGARLWRIAGSVAHKRTSASLGGMA